MEADVLRELIEREVGCARVSARLAMDAKAKENWPGYDFWCGARHAHMGAARRIKEALEVEV